jgi:hypothetical protein
MHDVELENDLIDKSVIFLLMGLRYDLLDHLLPVAHHAGRDGAFNCNQLSLGTTDATFVNFTKLPSSKAFAVALCHVVQVPFGVDGNATCLQYFTTISVEKFPSISSLKQNNRETC